MPTTIVQAVDLCISDEHFLTVARYVERNALRAKLVNLAEHWQFSSLWRWAQKDPSLLDFLSDWPVERPPRWLSWVNQTENDWLYNPLYALLVVRRNHETIPAPFFLLGLRAFAQGAHEDQAVAKSLSDIVWGNTCIHRCMLILTEALVKADFLRTPGDDIFRCLA
jgi:hypothetical protein